MTAQTATNRTRAETYAYTSARKFHRGADKTLSRIIIFTTNRPEKRPNKKGMGNTMSASSDWMPTSRPAMIEMAKTWASRINGKLQAWNVPQETLSGLMEKTGALDALNATPPSERTPVIAAQLKTAEKALAETMRDIKKRHFFSPPLEDSDIVALGLRPKDGTPTPVGAPTAPAEGELAFPSKGIVEIVKIRPGGANADKRASYGVRIYYGTLGDKGKGAFKLAAPPATGDDLPHSVFTKTRSHSFDFTAERGNQAFFCMRYENSKGQCGPWGDIIEAFVP
jgi:hypothetical protein